MKTFYLYKIVNSVNQKVYIGITSRPKERLREHFSKSSSCVKLSRAVLKHGKNNFTMTLLCAGEEGYIIDLENKAIQAYDSIKSGYNLMNGHPNKNGTLHSEDSKNKISESLYRFYENNISKNKGSARLSLRDSNCYYVTGFWFPNRNLAMTTLKMNKKSFYSWRKEGTLGDVCHPAVNSRSHEAIYVLGFWFENLTFASQALGRDKYFLLMLLNKNLQEESIGKIGSKPRIKPKGSNFGVNQTGNGNYRAILWQNKIRLLDRTFKSLQEALTAYDDCYEEIHNSRPNKTVKGAIP